MVALSGIDERTREDCEPFAAELRERGVRVSLLVPPTALVGGAPVLGGWLGNRTAAGDELVLHGLDLPHGHQGSGLGFRRTVPEHEAGLRLVAVRAALDRVGLSSRTFTARSRRLSEGTMAALHAAGFAVCADANHIRVLRSGRIHRAQSRTFEGILGEHARCRALPAAIDRAARRESLVRLSVDAADIAVPGRRQAVRDAVDLALRRGFAAATYGELAPLGRSSVHPPPRPPRQRRVPNLDPLTS